MDQMNGFEPWLAVPDHVQAVEYVHHISEKSEPSTYLFLPDTNFQLVMYR